MAGNFPDVPGFRFEYDRDGSTAHVDGTSVGVSALQTGNNEDWTTAYNCQSVIGIAWPEPRDVTGICIMNSYGLTYLNDPYQVRCSANTTNGADGTWSFMQDIAGYVYSIQPDVKTFARSNIQLITAANRFNLRGLQFSPYNYRGGSGTKILHIYGNTAPTSNPDRLMLCDGNGSLVTNGAYFDFGDSARSTLATKQFRILNHSATSTANSITISFDVLTNANPSLLTQFAFSIDNGASYVTSYNIGNLGPGQMTSTFLLRRNTLAGAATGPWQLRLLAIPASMT